MLSDVPTLPCRKHGAPSTLTDLEKLAYDCYAMLSKDKQFHYRERQKGRKRYYEIVLDYQAVRHIMDLFVDDTNDRQDTFRLIRMIHHAIYGDDEAQP